MKVSRNWLQTYFDEEIPSAEKLEELFTFHSFEVESIDEILAVGNAKADAILDVKILPDRAHYDLSHKGVAEEISVLTKLPIKERFVGETKATIKDAPTVNIQNGGSDSKFCRRYTARLVELGQPKDSAGDSIKSGSSNSTGNSIKNSPEWLKNALESIGQRSINSIVDATNYVMYNIGQPLHAFDADKVKGAVVIRPAKDGEKIVLLDSRELTLTSADHVIADDEGPLVVAGAKGGKRAEITESTERIMIESANFDPTMVRRTSTKYDIRSDSSKRFENEITPELAMNGMNNICGLIAEIFSNAKFGPVVDEYPVKPTQTIFDFHPEYLAERLGVEIPLDEARGILERMRVVVKEKMVVDTTKSSSTNGAESICWTLTIPYERLDLVIKDDVVEEIGRVYGYDHVKGILPPVEGVKNVSILPLFYFGERVKNILTALGFSEVSLYSLVGKGEIEVAKPLARDKAFARMNLADGMKACLERNSLNADLLGLEAIKVFEFGHVFSNEGEKVHLAIGVNQIKKIKGLKAENIVAEALSKIESALDIKIAEKPMNDKVGNSCIFEIDLDCLVKSFKVEISFQALDFKSASDSRYEKFSLYPFIVRDVAVFVGESISSGEVWSAIESGIAKAGASGLLVRHALFDTFKKDGKVSYAFRMVFQSMEKTLTDEEANKIMESLYAELKGHGWEVR